MKAAQFFFDGFVDDAVILNGRFPAHPADQPDRFHPQRMTFPGEMNLPGSLGVDRIGDRQAQARRPADIDARAMM